MFAHDACMSPHLICETCHGKKCLSSNTCNVCVELDEDRWKFFQKRSTKKNVSVS